MRTDSITFVAAPVCLFFYGICWLLDGRQGFHGPGVFWNVGHVFFLFTFIAFIFVVWNLQSRLDDHRSRRIAYLSAVVAYVGIAIFLRVGVIDLITGFTAVNHASMAPISQRLNAWPDARLLPLLRLGPVLFQLGMMALIAQLSLLRRLQWWAPLLVLSGFLLAGFDLRFLMLGAILMEFGFAPLIRRQIPKRTALAASPG